LQQEPKAACRLLSPTASGSQVLAEEGVAGSHLAVAAISRISSSASISAASTAVRRESARRDA